MMQEERCDVLIVGGGGAALRAAIAAKDRAPQLRVLVATKGALGKSGVTATACSDRMAYHATLSTTEPGGPDAWKYHADDIYRIGGYVSDGDLATILARNAAASVDDLVRWGVPFVRKPDGTLDQFVTDGSRYARALYSGPYTANHIEAALVAQVQQRPIDVLEHTLVADLLPSVEGDRVAGALIVHEQTGEVGLIQAKTVVLATGGAGQAFAVNVYPPDVTGDGYAMAYRLGAQLVNLEFIQIGLSSILTKLACSGDMMRALPRVTNSEGREFLADYFPAGTSTPRIHNVLFAKGASWPVSYQEPSHIIDIAVFYERAAGRPVYLDYGSNPTDFDVAKLDARIWHWYREVRKVDLATPELTGSPLQRLTAINPQIVRWLGERGINLNAGERVEIAPAIQHFQGGIKIRQQASTSLLGLYAAGEVAGGQHGANRPGGNALMDSQVFGRIAGESAAAEALSHERWVTISGEKRERALAWLKGFATNRTSPMASEVRQLCQETMANVASVVRTRSKLDEGLARLDELSRRGIRADEKGLAYAVETANILVAGKLVVRAARERLESRGPHLMFADLGDLQPLPPDDVQWRRYIVLQREGDQIKATVQTPIPL